MVTCGFHEAIETKWFPTVQRLWIRIFGHKEKIFQPLNLGAIFSGCMTHNKLQIQGIQELKCKLCPPMQGKENISTKNKNINCVIIFLLFLKTHAQAMHNRLVHFGNVCGNILICIDQNLGWLSDQGGAWRQIGAPLSMMFQLWGD